MRDDYRCLYNRFLDLDNSICTVGDIRKFGGIADGLYSIVVDDCGMSRERAVSKRSRDVGWSTS